eukprot:2527047-Rhodomonas_salina.1
MATHTFVPNTLMHHYQEWWGLQQLYCCMATTTSYATLLHIFWRVLGKNAGKGRRSAGMPDNDHTNEYGLGKLSLRQCAIGSFDLASVPHPIRSETEYFSDMITGFVGEQ